VLQRVSAYCTTKHIQEKLLIWKKTQPEETSRPSSYWHCVQSTLLLASRRHPFSDLNCTMIHESPMRQSWGRADNELTVWTLGELFVEWQLPAPPWHHHDSEPSSQLSEGSGNTRPTLKPYNTKSYRPLSGIAMVSSKFTYLEYRTEVHFWCQSAFSSFVAKWYNLPQVFEEVNMKSPPRNTSTRRYGTTFNPLHRCWATQYTLSQTDGQKRQYHKNSQSHCVQE